MKNEIALSPQGKFSKSQEPLLNPQKNKRHGQKNDLFITVLPVTQSNLSYQILVNFLHRICKCIKIKNRAILFSKDLGKTINNMKGITEIKRRY